MSDAPFDPEIRTQSAQPTVCVRVMASTSTLGELFSTHPARLVERLTAAGAVPAGAVFGRYHLYSEEEVDVEIGLPVDGPVDGLDPLSAVSAGEVGASELPAGRVAAVIHFGSYRGLPATYERLHEWIHAQGESEGPGPWEIYLDDPGDMSGDIAKVRTEVVWPLAPRAGS